MILPASVTIDSHHPSGSKTSISTTKMDTIIEESQKSAIKTNQAALPASTTSQRSSIKSSNTYGTSLSHINAIYHSTNLSSSQLSRMSEMEELLNEIEVADSASTPVPTTSPQTSPKTSPRISPKISPKSSPKTITPLQIAISAMQIENENENENEYENEEKNENESATFRIQN